MIALVIAEHQDEYRYFLRKYQLSSKDYRYCYNWNSLCGYGRETPIILYGNYKLIRDFYYMKELLKHFSNVVEWQWCEDDDFIIPDDYMIKKLPGLFSEIKMGESAELEMRAFLKDIGLNHDTTS